MKYFLRVKEITCDVRKDEVKEILRILNEMNFKQEEKETVAVVKMVLESRIRLADIEMESAKESVWQ